MGAATRNRLGAWNVDRLDANVEGVDAKVDRLDVKVDGLDRRFDEIAGQLAIVLRQLGSR